MRNEALEVVERELTEVGIPYSVDPTSRHIKLRFTVGNIEKTQVLPKTSSDWRAAKNARALLRKTLRDLGVQLGETPAPEPPVTQPQPQAPAPAPKQHHFLLERALASNEALAKQVRELEVALARVNARITELEARETRIEQHVHHQHIVRERFVRPSVLRRMGKGTKRRG